ncbi:MAG TPA: type II secretion system F family protein [Lacipirellulaceae bacterium]|jgi:type IV pilus assembly protein PilC
MRRAKKTLPGQATALTAAAGSHKSATRESWWAWLTKPRRRGKSSIQQRDLVYILRNLATLTQNGVSLPKALGTLAEEQALGRHREMILALRRRLENGETFSAALKQFKGAFDAIMINQIKVGEHSGTLPETLDKLATHCEQASDLRAEIVRKLAYPIVLIVMGSAVITFLLLYVVPVFKETYDKAKVPLPFITQVLIGVGAFAKHYGLFFVGAIVIVVVTIRQLRKRPEFAYNMDRALLHGPVIGKWFRDIAVLQVMEVLGSLMEAGFTLADALGETIPAVNNRAVQQTVRDLQSAIRRGERFSRELERHGDMFPPIVSQLVIIGEQTGKLTGATTHICGHLKREVQRKTNIFVGALEPILTICLASAVAVILLAIYLPMFDMVNTVSK